MPVGTLPNTPSRERTQHPTPRRPCLKVGSLRNSTWQRGIVGVWSLRFLPLHHHEYMASLVMHFLGGWHSYFAFLLVGVRPGGFIARRGITWRT